MVNNKVASSLNAHQYSKNINNFDLLRLAFAITVFCVHAAVLAANNHLLSLTSFLSSEVAVKSFFVVSGFLIFMGYQNPQTMSSFFSKRIRRIYPAYLFVILASVLMGVFFTTLADIPFYSPSSKAYFSFIDQINFTATYTIQLSSYLRPLALTYLFYFYSKLIIETYLKTHKKIKFL